MNLKTPILTAQELYLGLGAILRDMRRKHAIGTDERHNLTQALGHLANLGRHVDELKRLIDAKEKS